MAQLQQDNNRRSQRLKDKETEAKKQAERKGGKKVRIGPREPANMALKLGRASSWGKWQLDMIGVIFAKKRTLELNHVLKVTEEEWPYKLQQRNLDSLCHY